MEKLIKDFEIPNKKIETWKFTDLNKVFEKNKFEPFVKKNVTNKNESTTISSNIKNNIFFNNENNFIIFENFTTDFISNFFYISSTSICNCIPLRSIF